MEHNFANLTTVLSRCSAKIANNVIEEIRAAINDALQGEHRSSAALTKMSFNLKKVKAERAAERAERRAAKKAAQQTQTARQGASIEVTTSEEYTNSAALYNINHQAFDYMCDSEDNACHIFSNNHPNVDDFLSTIPENLCDELATQIRAVAEIKLDAEPSISLPISMRCVVNRQMAGYLKRCSEENIQSILNCYFHLLFTGRTFTPADPRYFNNFLSMARAYGIVTDGTAITPAQLNNFLNNNPVLPLNRAQRRRLKQRRCSHSYDYAFGEKIL